MNLSPIVIFVYNRPWHTQKTIEALKNNELASESELFIYADNAKNNKIDKQVLTVRKYIKKIDGFKKVTIVEREKNFGLADSIIEGVSQIVKKYGRVIVLEDDLVTSPFFLRYMNDALVLYKNEETVMHISGYIYPIDNKYLNDTFFIKPDTCWGWATWDRAWIYFKKDTKYYLSIFDKKMIKEFNLNNSFDYFSQIKQNGKGKINTWAIFWYASIFLRNGLSLHPSKSFVSNIGHDGLGTHCNKSDFFDVPLIEKYPISFVKDIKEDMEARACVEIFFKKLKLPFFLRIFRRIMKILKNKI